MQDTLNIQEMKKLVGYWYVASPYSKYPGGMEEAFEEVSRAAGFLVEAGLSVFAPITHSHPIAKHGHIDPKNHTIWLPADKPLMLGAVGLVVCMLPSWEDSYGVRYEQDVFCELGKPSYYMRWPR